MSKFKFEWKIGDRYKRKSDSKSLSLTYKMNYLIPEEEWSSIKPFGKKTKARYKAERLAWKQSRIAVGDWVEVIRGDSSDRESYQSGAQFMVLEVRGYEHICASSGVHKLSNLKPCKPPKPKVITEGQFELDGNSLIALKYMDCWGSVAIHDGKSEVVFNAYGGRPIFHPDDLRSIATLLDLYQASIDAGQA